MKRKRYTDEQIGFVLRQAEAGTPIGEFCRKTGIFEQTSYRWKKKFAGMGVAEIRRLKQLEDENRRLKTLVADLTLDKTIVPHRGDPPFAVDGLRTDRRSPETEHGLN